MITSFSPEIPTLVRKWKPSTRRPQHHHMILVEPYSYHASPPLRRSLPLRNNAKRLPFSISATVAAPKRETDPKKRVVITGMGIVSVFGNDVDAYYEKLLAGESGITPINRFDASKFPTRFAGQIQGFESEGYIDGKNDRRSDDSLRYSVVAGKKALEAAGLGGYSLDKV
ncbi:hypothetical protein RD792_003924 [Penstemon davidsonii]|uniref:beta-ketoacyl-[acyl-carrier-protein] synthase I n=1 Tax=Penstemon davidsonii TaxID=160366 RepID=A0ABR0DGY7_9LAMI|nr:hypothetical protein RD792_003924 [Penstemon davidsonii]